MGVFTEQPLEKHVERFVGEVHGVLVGKADGEV